ncbi:MAG TPA: sigma-70 family RNA polymerase sigma factor [Sphingomicrobium sp.]|jgi:RNA polymerase sigma-70 factor (ECF subfamily)|nr:sigma-70 family RNA polymerase sigma factor [Sphingomicrobium sp.]
MEIDELLFQRESGRMVGALTRVFGVHNLALAEDVVQEAFCRALEAWTERGPPLNPQAWLMTTAKNCALDAIRRRRTAARAAPELSAMLRSEWTLVPVLDQLLSPDAVRDDQLCMMFSCGDPRLAEASQVMLILHILCGLSIAQVAAAFMTSYSAVEKRLGRAKKVLADAPGLFDVSAPKDVTERLPAVQRALYLLFNEGYHGASPRSAVRPDLCREAMRLTAILLQDSRSATPTTSALAALMSLHAARLPARLGSSGELVALSDQDRSRWDQALIAEGLKLLSLSASGTRLSEYHLEAAIAAEHAAAPDADRTNWAKIVLFYDQLLAIRKSPVVSLNRAIALAQAAGPDEGLGAISEIEGANALAAYPFYPATLGQLELQCGRPDIAAGHFREAESLARNTAERNFLTRRAQQSVGAPGLRRLDTYGETVNYEATPARGRCRP